MSKSGSFVFGGFGKLGNQQEKKSEENNIFQTKGSNVNMFQTGATTNTPMSGQNKFLQNKQPTVNASPFNVHPNPFKSSAQSKITASKQEQSRSSKQGSLNTQLNTKNTNPFLMAVNQDKKLGFGETNFLKEPSQKKQKQTNNIPGFQIQVQSQKQQNPFAKKKEQGFNPTNNNIMTETNDKIQSKTVPKQQNNSFLSTFKWSTQNKFNNIQKQSLTEKSGNMFQKKNQPLIIDSKKLENKANKISQQTLKKDNAQINQNFGNFDTIKSKNINQKKLDVETIKKDVQRPQRKKEEGKKTNLIVNYAVPKLYMNVKKISEGKQQALQDIEEQIKQDIIKGRKITSKQQIKELLVAQRKELKDNLINLLKSQKRNVILLNHGQEHTKLAKERIDMIKSNNQTLRTFENQLFSEVQGMQKTIVQLQKTQINYNIISLPNFGKIDSSMKAEDYLKQFYKFAPPKQLLNDYRHLNELENNIKKLEQQIKIVQKSYWQSENDAKKRRLSLLNVSHQIINIFEQEEQFKVYCNKYLTKKISDLEEKYRQLKQDVKKSMLKKQARSKISFNSMIY